MQPLASEPQSTHTRYLYRPFDDVAGGGCHADVYLPEKAPEEGKSWPVALAIHGGSFCLFGAKQIPFHQIDHLTTRGIAVVSIEYRLGPHFSLYDAIDDCAFAYNWVKTELNGLIGKGGGKGKVNGEKMVVFGSSAGGYLALMIAQKVSPAPLAVTCFYPVTDWTVLGQKSDQDAWKEDKDEKTIAYCEKVHEGKGLSDWHDGAFDDPPPPRMAFVRACSGAGCLLANLLPPSETLTPEIAKALSPIHNVSSPNNTTHPPTFLVVPSADQLVPPSQTHTYAEKLKEAGVKHEVGVVNDAAHAFEWVPDERNQVGEGEWWKDSEKAMKWLVDHV